MIKASISLTGSISKGVSLWFYYFNFRKASRIMQINWGYLHW